MSSAGGCVLITVFLILLTQKVSSNTCRCDCIPIQRLNLYQDKNAGGLGNYHRESLQDQALQAHIVHLVPMARGEEVRGHVQQAQQHQAPGAVEEKKYETSEHQISKVSSNQDNHYIKLEQHIPLKKAEDEEGHHKEGHDHHDKDVFYKFEYAVNDKKTHDIKSQKEERRADQVNGEYSLVEPDGNIRTVKYQADWKNGFYAEVHNSKEKQSFG